MIVADTSSLISLTTVDLLDTVLTEFDVHTSETVAAELETTAEYDDRHGNAAETVLDNLDRITTHQRQKEFTSSRIDHGEGTCALLIQEIDAEFLITADRRALPELQTVADARVAIPPIVLKALVRRDALQRERASNKLDELAERRNWLGAPIYRRAQTGSLMGKGSLVESWRSFYIRSMGGDRPSLAPSATGARTALRWRFASQLSKAEACRTSE